MEEKEKEKVRRIPSKTYPVITVTPLIPVIW